MQITNLWWQTEASSQPGPGKFIIHKYVSLHEICSKNIYRNWFIMVFFIFIVRFLKAIEKLKMLNVKSIMSKLATK